MTPADELRAAAQTLRDVAPQITGPLAGLADPVANWLDYHAAMTDRLNALVDGAPDHIDHPALAVARAVLGSSDG